LFQFRKKISRSVLVPVWIVVVIFLSVQFLKMSAWGATSSPLRSCDALIERIEQNDPTLTDLVILPNKKFGDQQLDRLCAVLQRPTTTNIHWASLSASGHALSPESLFRLGKAIASSSATTSGLRSIAVGDSLMGDDGVSAFCQGLQLGDHSLQQIFLSFKGIGTDGFCKLLKTLGKSTSLEKLDLSRNDGIGEAWYSVGDYDNLFPCVRELDLSDCGISSRLAIQLFPQIISRSDTVKRTLRLSGNPFGPKGLEALKGLFHSAGSLYISNCSLGDDGMAALHSLVCDGFSCDMTLLDISQNGIEKMGASRLAQCLSGGSAPDSEPFFRYIEELILAGNNLGEEGTELLIRKGLAARAAKGLPSLKMLDLSETNCGLKGATAVVTESCAIEIRLFGNNLGSEGFRALAALVIAGRLPHTLESLDLAGNNADMSSVLELLKAVLWREANPSSIPSRLTSLVIGGNQGGLEVESMIRLIQKIRPDMDIGRDRPTMPLKE
jgi:Ran GTPase-activating protein (RanGAP) involved in mRNA processing and transport